MPLNSEQSITGAITPSNGNSLFNTIIFGPEMNLSFKRFFFPGSLFKKSRVILILKRPSLPVTTSKTAPDYNRSILTFSYIGSPGRIQQHNDLLSSFLK